MQMPGQLRTLLRALGSILTAFVLFVGCVLYYYHNSQLLKASQSQMMWVILVSIFFCCARVFLSSYNINMGSCTASFWFGHLGTIGKQYHLYPCRWCATSEEALHISSSSSLS